MTFLNPMFSEEAAIGFGFMFILLSVGIVVLSSLFLKMAEEETGQKMSITIYIVVILFLEVVFYLGLKPVGH